MYETTTRSIRITVQPEYQAEQSEPADNQYFWSYTIDIFNEGTEPVTLRSRHWRITDANGRTEEVRGPGVIGQQPLIEPGKSFSYTSGCPLRTPQGLMVGSYQMMDSKGGMFDVAIPAFSLDSPYMRPTLN